MSGLNCRDQIQFGRKKKKLRKKQSKSATNRKIINKVSNPTSTQGKAVAASDLSPG